MKYAMMYVNNYNYDDVNVYAYVLVKRKYIPSPMGEKKESKAQSLKLSWDFTESLDFNVLVWKWQNGIKWRLQALMTIDNFCMYMHLTS